MIVFSHVNEAAVTLDRESGLKANSLKMSFVDLVSSRMRGKVTRLSKINCLIACKLGVSFPKRHTVHGSRYRRGNLTNRNGMSYDLGCNTGFAWN